MPTRRLRTVFAATLLSAVAAVHAGAPQQKTQAGWFRTMLGDFEVTALADGTVKLPIDQLLTNTTEAALRQAVARSFLTIPTETSVNAYLVNTGEKLVLVDTGAAGLFGPTLGNRRIAHARGSTVMW